MICSNPYVNNGKAYGCGQCLSCRINRQRVWAHRIMLEASMYGDNAFVTLTYNELNLPEGGTLVPRHLKLWLMRLRKRGQRFRYYSVGEYGDTTERPHYHIALFGHRTCARGLTKIGRSGYCCEACAVLQGVWDYGYVYSGTLTPHSAAYIAGYVTKKMTHATDIRLNGRHAEFARMSLRPGIGAGFMDEVADSILSHNLEDRLEDVPLSLRHGPSQKPLGRYLRGRLRERIGRGAKTPEIILERLEEEMRPLRESAFANSESFKARILEENHGKIIQAEYRHRFRRKGKRL